MTQTTYLMVNILLIGFAITILYGTIKNIKEAKKQLRELRKIRRK